MKKTLLGLLAVIGLSTLTNAQVIYNSTGRKGDAKYRENAAVKGFDKNKLIFGTGFELGLWGNYFNGGISPTVGYRITDWFAAGITGRFSYKSIRDNYAFPDNNGGFIFKPQRARIFGPSVWTRFSFLESYFIHAEFEYNINSITGYEYNHQTIYQKISDSYNTTSLMLGVGFKSYLTDRLSFTGTVLYDVLQNVGSNLYVDPNNPSVRTSLSPYSGQLNYRLGLMFNF